MKKITFLLQVAKALREKHYDLTLMLTYFNTQSDHRAFAILKLKHIDSSKYVNYLELYTEGESFAMRIYNFKRGSSDINMEFTFHSLDELFVLLDKQTWCVPGALQNVFDESIEPVMSLMERLGDTLDDAHYDYDWDLDTFMSHAFVTGVHDATGVPMTLLSDSTGLFAVPSTKHFIHFSGLNIVLNVGGLFLAHISYRLKQDGTPSSFRLVDSEYVRLQGDFSESKKFSFDAKSLPFAVDDLVDTLLRTYEVVLRRQ